MTDPQVRLMAATQEDSAQRSGGCREVRRSGGIDGGQAERMLAGQVEEAMGFLAEHRAGAKSIVKGQGHLRVCNKGL